MSKRLTMICAALLLTGLAACNRGGGNGSDDDRLNAAANMLNPDNGVYDTSADDAALNQAELPADQAGPGNGAAANVAAPGGSAAAPAGNRQ